jgi:hypothetical protein
MPKGHVERFKSGAQKAPLDLREIVSHFKAGIRKAPDASLADFEKVLKEAFREVTFEKLDVMFTRGAIPPPPPGTHYNYDLIFQRTYTLRAEGRGTEEIAKIIRTEDGPNKGISRRHLDNIWRGWSTSFDPQK